MLLWRILQHDQYYDKTCKNIESEAEGRERSGHNKMEEDQRCQRLCNLQKHEEVRQLQENQDSKESFDNQLHE